jgi:hypothetical protein
MHEHEHEEEERGKDVQENVHPYNDYFVCGEGGGNGIGLEATTFASLIYNVFIKYVKTFGTSRLK